MDRKEPGELMRCNIRTGSVEDCLYYPQLDPEGDYRIGEYQALLERSVGISADTSAIREIIWKEVESCFPETGMRQQWQTGPFLAIIDEYMTSFKEKFLR